MKIWPDFHFQETRTAPLPELNATLHQMEHLTTGARLVWLERAEENKTFGIAFPTLPEDDTGVFHILEHSVLCGSDKYPVKEPFVELLKHSMNTFLNAITFPDKTLYPISSRNDKDFFTLMRVYLDAVFHPAIYHRPEIFRQEGWRYEFDAQGNPHYKGVVFNEMKGAFADADELELNAINQALFPDTPYRYVSGGDPASIPDLTYEQFLDNHRRFYAPSNALIFLDGAVDLDAVLKLLDEEYLSGFERTPATVFPPLQKPLIAADRTVEYEVSSPEEETGRTRLAWGFVLGSFADRETLAAAQVLAEVLAGDNEAPLCRAVLSRQLAEEVRLQVMDGVAQPWMLLEIRNLKPENAAAARQAVTDTLTRLAEQGIDRTKLEAALAHLEFQMRERDYGSYPPGIIFCMQVLESWLYGGQPEANLQVGDLFDKLRAKMQEGYFEQLLRRVLLDNGHRCQVTMQPSHTAGEARRRREADRLAREAAAWTPEDRAALMQLQRDVDTWQKTPDSPEQLATLPCLTLADVSDRPEPLPLEPATLAGLPVLLHRMSTGGIVYLNLYFDANGLDGEQLSRLGYLCRLLGNMPTARHTAEELNDLTRLLCGDLQFYASVFSDTRRQERCRVKFCVSMSALESKLPQALDLLTEILTQTRLEEAAARDILRQRRTSLTENCIMAGHQAAASRLMAQFSAAGVAQEYLNGFAGLQWAKQQEEHWDWAALQPALEALLAQIAVGCRLTLGVTAPDELAKQAAERLVNCLPQGTPAPETTLLAPWGTRREGIAIPADISFACCGGNLMADGQPYNGAWQLVSKLVSLEYLWNVIRVQGGAYGTGLLLLDIGLAACYSYRDPRGSQSLESYARCAEFLRQFCREGKELTGLIIGTVSDSEPLLSPRARAMTADNLYWRGVSYEDRCRRRRELLAATPETLTALADTLERALNGGVCVVGGKPQLDACNLDHIESV